MFNTYCRANISRKLGKRALGRVETIERRIRWLEERENKTGLGLESYDRRERSALQWALSYIKQHQQQFGNYLNET